MLSIHKIICIINKIVLLLDRNDQAAGPEIFLTLFGLTFVYTFKTFYMYVAMW